MKINIIMGILYYNYKKEERIIRLNLFIKDGSKYEKIFKKINSRARI